MNETAFLNKVKQMRFKEAYEGYQAKRLSQEEVARLLSLCDRSFRRYSHQYEDSGLNGLLDQRLCQVSHRCAPVDEFIKLQDLYSSRYRGWNMRHFHEWYRPLTTVNVVTAGLRIRYKEQIWCVSRRLEAHRIKRLPSALPCMMIH